MDTDPNGQRIEWTANGMRRESEGQRTESEAEAEAETEAEAECEAAAKAESEVEAETESEAEATVEAVIEIKHWTNVLKHFSQPKLKQNKA